MLWLGSLFLFFIRLAPGIQLENKQFDPCNLQQQLIRMEMDDPALMTAIGAPWGLPIPAESARIRDHLYIHMWATF